MFAEIAVVQKKPGRAPAKPSDKHLPVFERILGRTIKALERGVVEAKGRFHSEGMGENAPETIDEKSGKVITPEIKDGVYVTAKASTCWKVHKQNDANPGQDELVYIGIPCGNKYMVWWKDADGKPTGQKLVKSGEVVAQLESWLGTMKGLDKTSSHGKEFWAHAIENSEPPKQKGKDEKNKEQKHDKITDFWVDK